MKLLESFKEINKRSIKTHESMIVLSTNITLSV